MKAWSYKPTYLSEVVQTLWGEDVVVPLPRELGLDETPGGQGLHGLDDFQVLDVGDVRVGRCVELLGSGKDTLLEESLVDCSSVGLGNQHVDRRELKEGSRTERQREGKFIRRDDRRKGCEEVRVKLTELGS